MGDRDPPDPTWPPLSFELSCSASANTQKEFGFRIVQPPQ